MKFRVGMERFLMNENILGDEGGGGGGEGAPPSAADVDAEKFAETLKSIYGEVVPKFPEGLENSLRVEPSVKPFVDKEGNLNYANLLKSYVETKKTLGKDRVSLPTDKSSPEDVEAFWTRLGWEKDAAKYALSKQENSPIEDKFLEDFKKFAHESKVPVNVAQGMLKFLEGKVNEVGDSEAKAINNKITEDIANLKKEYGQAYEHKVGLAKRLLKETLSPEDQKIFSDPSIGSNPALIKTLVSIAQKVYREDGFTGGLDSAAQTPSEATAAINAIMADKKHPYWNKNDARHSDAVKEMEQLHRWRNAAR